MYDCWWSDLSNRGSRTRFDYCVEANQQFSTKEQRLLRQQSNKSTATLQLICTNASAINTRNLERNKVLVAHISGQLKAACST